MASDLLKLIESDEVAAKFYLISDTDSLYRWISSLPAVAALEDLITTDPQVAALIASRVLDLYKAPATPGYRTEHEPAICCYAYILCRLPNEYSRPVLIILDATAGPPQGWLRPLLNKCLQGSSTTKSSDETYAPSRSRNVSVVSTTPRTLVQHGVRILDSTSFDALQEFDSWTPADYLDLKAAA